MSVIMDCKNVYFLGICFCLHFSYISVISGSRCSVSPDLFVALLIGYGAATLLIIRFSLVKTKMKIENEPHDFLIWINAIFL